MICCSPGSSSTLARWRYSDAARTVRSTRSRFRVTRPCQAPSGKMVLRGPLALVVAFADGSALEATEQGTEKRLAVYIVSSVTAIAGVARLGVDALDDGLTAEHLGSLLRRQRGTLKNVLADQAVIAG